VFQSPGQRVRELRAFTLGYGLVGVSAGIVLSYACWAAVAVAGFARGGWADAAAAMIAERDAAVDAETEAAESDAVD